MQVVLSTDLADRFDPLDRFQSDFELKVIAVLLSFFGQFFPPQALMFLPYSILARGPVFRVNYKPQRLRPIGGPYRVLWLPAVQRDKDF